MKYWRITYKFPTISHYRHGYAYKWARTAKDAEKLVKKVLSGNKGPVEILSTEEWD